MVTSKIKNQKLLTEVELEIMNVIWDLAAECTVKDVQLALPASRELAYTSVATIMKILEQKKVLHSQKREKAHVFSALLSRKQYEGLSLHHLTDSVFKGQPASLVMRLLNEADMSEDELASIRKMVDERLKT